MQPKLIAGITFLAVYVMLVSHKGKPPVVVWCGAAVMLITGVISFSEAVESINVNVLGIFLGTMIISDLLIHSNLPAYLASVLVTPGRSAAGAVMAVCLLSGGISAFVDNVATVLMVVPIAIEVSKQLEVTPVPFIIGIAVSANLQGAATLVGDSTSILLASAAKMTFTDFFWMNGRPGIFFSVQAGAIAAFSILYLVFRKIYKGSCGAVETVHVTSWVPTIIMLMMMGTMAVSSFIPDRPDWALGAIAMGYALFALLWNALTAYKHVDLRHDLDWSTVLLLCGLFIVVGSLTSTGLVMDMANIISNLAKGNAFRAYITIVWMSVLVSAFVDNIPFTMAMLPTAQIVANSLGTSPYVMMFGLLLGATLGGNITPIGASANIAAVSLLRREGYDVSFPEFLRIGLPFTLAAVITGSLVNWIIWS
ncbi:MAG TPA: SLC13 family permease [Bacillota bacterium]|nr:arsenic transporter [Candidatus Fermentithermobacillaceae bacterium]HOB30460.1 SLC13 family permease [Bacillota bacterium]HQD74292.1 SLC13 family permease [Bacillota bacterium]